nr:immunoglobulin heavy chain junction region [Mus musculus]
CARIYSNYGGGYFDYW